MPLLGGTRGAHDDSSHQGSAKRDAANGVAGLDVNGVLLAPGAGIFLTRNGSSDVAINERTSVENSIFIHRTAANDYTAEIVESNVRQRVQTASMKNVASGIAGLDASARIALAQCPTVLVSTGGVIKVQYANVSLAGADNANVLTVVSIVYGFVTATDSVTITNNTGGTVVYEYYNAGARTAGTLLNGNALTIAVAANTFLRGFIQGSSSGVQEFIIDSNGSVMEYNVRTNNS